MPNQSMPNVDFRRIPKELAGLWVVLRLGDDQEIVGQGTTPLEAMLQSNIDPNDRRYALTQVPDDRWGASGTAYAVQPNVSR